MSKQSREDLTELLGSESSPEELGQHLVIRFDGLCARLERICEELSGRIKPYYSIAEIAEMTGRSSYTVRRWIAEKRIAATRIEGTGPKGKLLVSRDQLQSLITAGLGSKTPAVVCSN